MLWDRGKEGVQDDMLFHTVHPLFSFHTYKPSYDVMK